MDTILKHQISKMETNPNPADIIYEKYMADILSQIPSSGDYKILSGTENSQVSFFFKDASTSKINEALYNNILSQRVRDAQSQTSIGSIELTSSAFNNSYLQLYTSLRFQLSQADKATQQKLIAETSASVNALVPIWNAWVKASASDVLPLPENDTNTALVIITATMTTTWLNPEFEQKLQTDPAYPYEHMSEFNLIFSKMPLSVPMQMRQGIQAIYNAQGAAGGLTTKVSIATQTINAIKSNVVDPDRDNGGVELTSDKFIPGLGFKPDEALVLVNQLSANPPTSTLTSSASVVRSQDTVKVSNKQSSGGISIPIFSFLSWGSASGGSSSSIFNENYVGSEFDVDIVVNNPTVNTPLVATPELYNISTQQGWMNADPVREALKNGTKTDVTGYVFDGGVPSFDFKKDGNFGYISTLMFSQFLELKLTFKQCDVEKVKKYFEQHSSASVSFLGISLGSTSQSSSYSYDFSDEKQSSVTVTMKPSAPGYTPGTSNINQSLCQLLAVGVTYPFAE